MRKAAICSVVLLLAVVVLGACAKRADLGGSGAEAVNPTPQSNISAAPGTGGPGGDAAAGRTGGVSESVARPTPPAISSSPVVRQDAAQGAQAAGPLQDVFFDFDKDVIRDDQKGSLDANAAWLKSHAGAKVTIEGHADERGTTEYNLALGDRRAKTTRDYLVARGVEPNRVTIVSYGEERPFVLGHDESAWRWNRRSHFVVSGQ
jgi:peptidoglycan-associated lipoprotein